MKQISHAIIDILFDEKKAMGIRDIDYRLRELGFISEKIPRRTSRTDLFYELRRMISAGVVRKADDGGYEINWL